MTSPNVRFSAAQLRAFFLLALGITWVCQLPYVLRARGLAVPEDLANTLMLPAAAGPAIAALIIVRRAGIRGAFSLRLRGVNFWLVVALLLLAALHLGAMALAALLSVDLPFKLYTPARPEHFAIAILAPIGEEPGWRGIAQPGLQQRLSPFIASLVVGVVWWLWHLPTFFIAARFDAAGNGLGLIFICALSVIVAWLYNKSAGAMSVALALHLGVHVDNVSRASAEGDGLAPLALTTIVAVLVALGIVVTDRAFRTAPQS